MATKQTALGLFLSTITPDCFTSAGIDGVAVETLF